MRKGFFYSSALIAVAAGVSLIFYLNAPVSRAITGYVYFGGESAPLAGARVELRYVNDGDRVAAETRTDEHGWFTFPELKSERCRVTAFDNNGQTSYAENINRGASLTFRFLSSGAASRK